MQDLLQKKLNESRYIPENKNLENFLFVKIQKRIQLITRIKFFSYLVMGILSSITLYFYVNNLYIDLINSGSYNYFHLIIGEDFGTLAILSKEIIYSIAESLPIMSLTLTLGLLFMVLVSFDGILTFSRKTILFKN